MLSFGSNEEEIDLWPLNHQLASENRLVLLHLSKMVLTPFKVSSITQLQKNEVYPFLEPNPRLCKCAELDALSVALIPGVVFDQENQRYGYGKGFYDRLLPRLTCPTWGVGFEEQRSPLPLEVEAHDIPVTRLFLF